MALSTADVAWVAGVIDSLGRVRVRQLPTGSRVTQVSVNTSKKAVAQRLGELTGMKVTEINRNYPRKGCSDHCPDHHLHVDSNTFKWEAVGVRGTVILRTVLPYLAVLAEEAEEVLTRCADAPYKPGTLAKVHALGWGVLEVAS